MFADDGISLLKLLQLSRDDPNLMKSVHIKLEIEAKKAGSPILLAGPCSLHPAYTAFKSALAIIAEMLVLDISSMLRKLHTWFKVSTARREDMAAIFALLEEIDSFYLRLVDTRWLSMEPALERFLEHEGSTREYFFNFIPNSTISAT